MNGIFNNTYNRTSRITDMTTNYDTLQKARQDLMGEIQAVMEYDQHIHNTPDGLAKMTWENIKSEELTHIGELLSLIDYLDPTQRQYVEQGMKEFAERKK